MKAGRELDALVAEKVMGITLGADCPGEIGELPNSADGWFCFDCGAEGGWGHDGHEIQAKSYSTDIAAAWEVVERIRDHFKHAVDVSACNSDKYRVSIALAPYPNSADAFEPTAPLAICLAALKAVGVEVPE